MHLHYLILKNSATIRYVNNVSFLLLVIGNPNLKSLELFWLENFELDCCSKFIENCIRDFKDILALKFLGLTLWIWDCGCKSLRNLQ